MLKFILAGLLACASAQAFAFDCLPKTAITPTATGSAVFSGETASGEWWSFWCPRVTAAGEPYWLPQFQVVLHKYRSAAAVPAVVWAVTAAADPVASVNAILGGLSVLPVAGSMEAYDYAKLRYDACLATFAGPMPEPDLVAGANPCGGVPVPPPPVYQTPVNGSLTVYKVAASGKLGGIISGKHTVAGALCDCTVKVMSGASMYCALAGGLPTEVTLCKKTTP
jgi:hypothetical protein